MALLILFGLAPMQAVAADACSSTPTTTSTSTQPVSNTTTATTPSSSSDGSGLSPCQKQLYIEGVLAFDTDPTSTGPSCGATTDAVDLTSISGNSKAAETIWDTLRGHGLSAIAVAGIMGNFHQEDGSFDPAVKQAYSTKAIPPNGDGVTGFGIAQWTSAGRQAALFAQIRAAGLGQYYGAGFGQPDNDLKNIKPDDLTKLLNVELEFAWSGDSTPIQSIASQLNLATTTAGDTGSTVLFHKLFERSGDNAAQIQQRVNDAAGYFKKYANRTVTTTASDGSSATFTADSSCAGTLGGVTDITTAIPWAKQFQSDTTTTYHPGGYDIPGGKPQENSSGDSILDLHHTNDGVVGGGSCWGGTYCGQCTALSGWFVTKMTGYTYGGGNGGEVVGNLAAKGVPTGTEPRAFSVFSYSTDGSSGAGHTGVVLGVLPNGIVITIENNWPSDGTLVVREYNIKTEHPDATFAYVGDKLKVSGLSTGQTGTVSL